MPGDLKRVGIVGGALAARFELEALEGGEVLGAYLATLLGRQREHGERERRPERDERWREQGPEDAVSVAASFKREELLPLRFSLGARDEWLQ